MKIKIAIDIRNIGKKRTGDETVFFHLVKELAKIDKENQYHLLIDTRSKGELKNITRRLGIENSKNICIVPIGSGNKFMWNGFIIPRYCKKHEIQIYHTQYIVPIGMQKTTKIVTHIHDVSFRAYPKHIRALDRFLLRLFVGLSLKRADAIIAISRFTADEIVRFYGEQLQKKLHIVPNATDVLQKTVSDEERVEARKRYALPRKYILYVGTHQPRKNLPTLLRAFDKFCDRIQDTALVLTGMRGARNEDRHLQKTLRDMRHADKVIFAGYVREKDLPTVYALAHIFAQPSLYEGFDLPILEAFRTGVPTVLSDIPVHREVAGSAANFFDANDVENLARVLYDTSVDEELRASLREKGTQRLGAFSWSSSADTLRQMYQSLNY